MKYLLLFSFFIPSFLSAQNQDWGAFNQSIDAKPYAGKKFRLQASVKVEQLDERSQAAVWVRVDKTDRKPGFFYNMNDKPITFNAWKEYTITGTIDQEASLLVFGGLYYRKGKFYYDDFKLFIETSKNKFEQVPIPNGDFEADSLRPNWVYFAKRAGFNLQLTAEGVKQGSKSVLVDGSGFVAPFRYGNNDSTGKYATVNGVKIYYEEYGKGEPLLFLHGNSQSIEAFTYQIPEFRNKYHIIAVDTRGQGKSSEDGKKYSYDLFAEDMKLLLDHLKLDSVNIYGWSDGGNTGLIMAMKYPSKVKRLVTMGANVFVDNTVVEKSTTNGVERQLKTLSADTSYRARNQSRLFQMLLTEPNHSFDELKIIKCPVLVVAGEKDVIKEGHTKGIAAAIQKSQLWIVPNESHYFPVDNWKAFNKGMMDFLTK